MVDWDTILYYLGLLLRDTRRMVPVYTIGLAFAVCILVTRSLTRFFNDKRWRADETRLDQVTQDQLRSRDQRIADLEERNRELEDLNAVLKTNAKGALAAASQGMELMRKGSMELIGAGFAKMNQGLSILGGIEPVGTREKSGTTREGKEENQGGGGNGKAHKKTTAFEAVAKRKA